MKRTTIMIEEELLYDLQQIAKQQDKSASSVIREALALYVMEQQDTAPVENPLLSLAGLGASATMTDVADGGDEAMLAEGVDTVTGWSVVDDSNH
jgi:hypothetical protein